MFFPNESHFLLGCNYWASNAGTDMWRDWDAAAVRRDLAILRENGAECLRVFPNWRDFQPIEPLLGGGGSLRDYILAGDRAPENEWYLDETMLACFGEFCGLAEEYGMKLIVGLVTGWMSGRLFIPNALIGKNLYTDPAALLFEQRLCRGIVTRFRDRPAIIAWDLGNECNCMNPAADEETAASWTGIISGAIRSADPTRPIVSGMHSLKLERAKGAWTIRGQAEFTDILTTHPYPYWVDHGTADGLSTFRASVQAACETKLYADISGRPCLIEEIGTMGPMIASEAEAADFIRVSALAGLSMGSPGLLWWCANEQTNLSAPPYSYQMCEVELGMIRENGEPKPVLREMARLRPLLDRLPALPKAAEDGVILLTRDQDQWGVGLVAWYLAREAGLNLRFAWCDDPLPEAPIYLMPSVTGCTVMNRANWKLLRQRVRDGAVLYFSIGNAVLSGFEALTGVRMEDSSAAPESGVFPWDGEEIPWHRGFTFETAAAGAEVLARDGHDRPLFTKHAFGNGTVYFLAEPMEANAIDENRAPDRAYQRLYRTMFEPFVQVHPAQSTDPGLILTFHGDIVFALNARNVPAEDRIRLADGCRITEVLYGDPMCVAPFDAAIFRIE